MSIKNILFKDANDFIDKLTQLWLSSQASDIHITPWVEDVLIKFRIWWSLKSIYTFSKDLYSVFINTVKVRSWMDISEHNHIQDWKIFLKIMLNWSLVWVNLRISTLPVLNWENIVMRLLLNESKYLEIDSLWFSKNNIDLLEQVADLNEWLVLVCWWTWSWKTTTIYSLLNTFDETKMSIFTLEDPVEYQIDWYIQSEVHNIPQWWEEMIRYSFAEWLVWILRQDPDIIMIWELRRKEESKTCFEAANTWHIVLWTIHSNNAVSVITRIRQFWVESYLIASWLKYIVSQKIVRWLCSTCREKVTIQTSGLPDKIKVYIKAEEINIYKSNNEWCSKCLNWYYWVELIWEVIKVNDTLYDLLLTDTGETEIKEYLYKNWFIPFYIDAFLKSIEWKISLDDALKTEY